MKKLLLCDDQKMLRKVLRDSILEMREDVEVHEATDGLDALEKIDQHDYDLVLLDVEMPNLSGFQALARIREWEKENKVSSKLKIVMITAMNSDQDIVKGWDLEADGYISKPYDIDEIGEALSQHL